MRYLLTFALCATSVWGQALPTEARTTTDTRKVLVVFGDSISAGYGLPPGQSFPDDLQMKLVSSRSWLYDRYLEEFNVGEPIPAAVRAMVQQQRSHRNDALDATGVQTTPPAGEETLSPSGPAGPAVPDIEEPGGGT